MRILINIVAPSLALLAAQSVWAQAGAPEKIQPLSMKYDATSHDVPPKRVKSACAIKLTPVVDARQNKETVGANYIYRPLLSGDAGAWATSGMQNLKVFGFTVDMATDADRTGALSVASRITRAYTWQVGMKLYGTVVVKVDYQLPGGRTESKTYRATGDKTNMWGADDEYMATLNYAFNNMLPKIAADLEKHCGGKA